jgi:hypothetical protein
MGLRMQQRVRSTLWPRWILANSIGELVGLGSTFALGAGLLSGLSEATGSGPALLTAALMTATGALEGVIVGVAQWSVLHAAVPTISRRAWVVATIIGGVVAWGAGSIPMTLASLSADGGGAPVQEPPQWLVLLLACGLGLVAGAILSVAQWIALRIHVSRAWRWLPANAIAWAVGMPLIFAGIDLAQKTHAITVGVLVMAATIALAGAVVGGIHGLVVRAFAAETEPRPSPPPR